MRIAERQLRDAVSRYPEHALTPSVYLELGNILFASARLRDAIASWEGLIEQFPRSGVRVEAHYNRGLAQRRVGDFAASRESLYRVVDGSPGHVLAPYACLNIGRTHLEDGNPDQAIPPLRRALWMSPGSECLPAATVTLAMAYLLADNPRAAGAILVEHRERVSQPPYRNTASFLASYAHYHAAADRPHAQREARFLLSSLLAVRQDPVLSPAGIVLLGRAYRELGLNEQMASIYQQTLQAGARGSIATEMSYALGEFMYSAGNRSAAVEHFSSVAGADNGNWTFRAKLRLAEIAMEDGRAEDCLTNCRTLLEQPRSADVPAVLGLMGKAFQQAGDHRRAAICFNGHLPED